MLKKSNYNEPGSTGTQSNLDISADVAQAGSGEKDSPVTMSTKSQDIPRVRPKTVSVFGSTLVFKGELSADEELLIQGTIEGTIAHQKKSVTIGRYGRVKALIHASRVKIEGRVDGDIHGDDFVLLADGAEVNGNIYCPRIKMDEGARFNGTIQMGQKSALSVAKRPAPVRDASA